MKAHTKLLISLALALAMFAGALIPSCVGAPKSVTEFVEMDDAEFEHWTRGVTLYSKQFAEVALPDGREDLEKLCAIIDGTTLIPHDATWATTIVPILLYEVEGMLKERGGIAAGSPRLFAVFEAVRIGVRQALDGKEGGP